MKDQERTEQLEAEVAALHKRVEELEGHEVELQRAQEALREGEARLRQIIDLVPHMIFAKDWDGHFLLANKAVAEAYGITVEQLTGTKHAEHHTEPTELEQMLSDDREVMSEGVPKFIPEETFVDAMGKQRVLQTIKIPYVISGENEPAVLGVALDITERRRAEEEKKKLEARLRSAEKRESLTTLAGGLAHDFRELVASILDNAAMARALRSLSSEGRQSIEDIERAARRAADLTNQLLVYAGEVRFQKHALFLNHLVVDMAHVLEVIISPHAKLEFDFEEDSSPVVADAGQLRQVVVNLVTNASEALGKAAGTIKVTVGVMDADRQYLSSTYIDDELDEGQYVYLEVADDGTGMDPDEQTKIFDPFFSRKFTGGGLGLAAVLGIVRGHNGTIKVDSTPGSGTTIRVLLPTPEIVPFTNA